MNEIDDKQAQIQAVTKIAETLSPLTPEQIQNVLIIIKQLYEPKATSQAISEKSVSYGVQENQHAFSAFHELFDAALPDTGSDRALVAAYWLQEVQGNKEMDSFLINKELKSLGEQSSNITRDLDVLVKRIPRWVHQTRKEGSSRKSYTVTAEGKKAVEKMLANHRTSKSVESDSNS